MLTESQLTDMIELQHKINSTVDKKWREAGNDWGLAIMAECIELADQIGWKWWKDQPSAPLTQVHLEVVDIWHFLLSAIIDREDVELLRMRLAAEPDVWLQDKPLDPYAVISALKRMSSVVGVQHIHTNTVLGAFFVLMRSTRLSMDDLYRLFVSKAVLNLFRQAHGYKEGSYIKQWGAYEDNVYLERLIEQHPSAGVDRLTGMLERAYRKVEMV